MNIAWFTPFSTRSAIGQCSALIIQALQNSARVTVFASDLDDPQDAWLPDAEIRSLKTIPQHDIIRELDRYDINIYNLGNFVDYHASIFDIARRRPGIVILHDLVMAHFFAGYYWTVKKNPAAFVKEMFFAHGERGRDLAKKFVDDPAGNEYLWHTPAMLQYNMARSTVYGSRGIVVHSHFAENILKSVAPAPVLQIDFPTPGIVEQLANRQSNSAGSGERLRLLSYGNIIPNKMIAEVIEAIGQRDRLRNRVIYSVIGGLPHEGYAGRIRELINQYRLENTVELLGYQSDDVLYDHIVACDISITLRNPHFGESSWTLLESLFAGKPTIVWDHGYYGEFPDSVVAKIKSAQTLGETLERLVGNDALRDQMGSDARHYAEETFVTEKYCQRLLGFIAETQQNSVALDLADSMAAMLFESGISAFPSDLPDRIASEIYQIL